MNKENNLSGMILINKDKNITSHDEVTKVQKLLREKVGHIGTLDPMATGVLPVLIGNACKLSKYLITHDKEYIVTMKFGILTTTLDITGEVIQKTEKETVKKIISEYKNNKYELLINKIKEQIGTKMQIPPVYSAKKYNGKKLYEIARQDYNMALEIAKEKASEITIYNIEDIKLEKLETDFEISFKTSVSGGTYIRSLILDIANSIGLNAVMTSLIRTKVNTHKLNDCVDKLQEIKWFVRDLDEEDKQKYVKILEENLIPINEVLKNITTNKVILKEHRVNAYLNGMTTRINNKEDGLYLVYLENNKLFGLGSIKNKELKKEILI